MSNELPTDSGEEASLSKLTWPIIGNLEMLLASTFVLTTDMENDELEIAINNENKPNFLIDFLLTLTHS